MGYTVFMADAELLIRPFTAADQSAARNLILEGLGEHFGFIDESYNPDLNDIMAHYIAPGQSFIVAEIHGKIVGTGALISEDERVGRIVRMSVARDERRKGIGQALIAHLIQRARERGFTRLVLETNLAWDDAMGFYRHCGFFEECRTDRLAHLALELT
jgi:GNAT superfamily N-acetyltransferase